PSWHGRWATWSEPRPCGSSSIQSRSRRKKAGDCATGWMRQTSLDDRSCRPGVELAERAAGKKIRLWLDRGQKGPENPRERRRAPNRAGGCAGARGTSAMSDKPELPSISEQELSTFRRCRFVHRVFRPRDCYRSLEPPADFRAFLGEWQARGDELLEDP